MFPLCTVNVMGAAVVGSLPNDPRMAGMLSLQCARVLTSFVLLGVYFPGWFVLTVCFHADHYHGHVCHVVLLPTFGMQLEATKTSWRN